jgi:predicted transport protein
MAKTPAEFEQEFIQTAKEKTGKSLDEWLAVVAPAGFGKQMEILNWLKAEHKLNHMQAGFVANIYLNKGKMVYQSDGDLLENQLAKGEAVRELFHAVSEKILKAFPGTKLISKKTYISFTAQREFAAINIKPQEIRLGLDLGDEAPNDRVQKSKLTGPMPRISHMIILTSANQFDEQVSNYLTQSYNRSNKK